MTAELVLECRRTCLLAGAHGDGPADCPVRAGAGSPNGGGIPVREVFDHESQLGHFDIRRCPSCELLFTDPQPTDETVGALYEGRATTDFDPVESKTVDALKNLLSRRGLRRLDRLTRIASAQRVLDFGCGDGRLAVNLAAMWPGVEVVASDFEPDAPPRIERARAGAGGATVRYVPHDEFWSEPGDYDVILLRHVLEHQSAPVRFLEALRDRLSERGQIWIEVPSARTIWITFFGEYWQGFYVPRHMVHFSPAGLERVCREAGLDVVDAAKADLPLVGRSLRNRTGGEYRLWMLGFGAVLYPVQVGVDRMLGRSSCLQVVCQRAADDGGA